MELWLFIALHRPSQLPLKEKLSPLRAPEAFIQKINCTRQRVVRNGFRVSISFGHCIERYREFGRTSATVYMYICVQNVYLIRVYDGGLVRREEREIGFIFFPNNIFFTFKSRIRRQFK